jgi:hypothetical protein
MRFRKITLGSFPLSKAVQRLSEPYDVISPARAFLAFNKLIEGSSGIAKYRTPRRHPYGEWPTP